VGDTLEDQIDSIVMRKNPELAGDYHLPMFARVEAVSDPITTPSLSEQFRPRYAVDLRVLDETDNPDPLFPLLRSVPLPAFCGGLERGVFGFPNPGAIVELAFAYGLPSKPFIRTVLSDGLSVPRVVPGELVLQASPEVVQRADEHGNWSRETYAAIRDESLHHLVKSFESLLDTHIHHIKVRQHSVEEITGVKIIEAMGALKLLSGGSAHLVAVDNLRVAVGKNQHNKVSGDLIQRIGNIADSFAVLKQIIKVQDGGKVWLGSEGENVLQILSELIQVVANIANIAKDHTHEYTDNGSPLNTKKPNQSGAYGGEKSSADALKSRLDPIVE